MKITAKVTCYSKFDSGEGDTRQSTLHFCPNYAGGANAEWAASTPALNLTMTVKGDVAHLFQPQHAYTLTFTPDQPEA